LTNNIYSYDGGSNQRFLIQPTANFSNGTVIRSQSTTSRLLDKRHSFLTWALDPITNDIYESWVLWNTLKTESSPRYKSYRLDRNNFDSLTPNYNKLFFRSELRQLTQVNDGLPTSILGTNGGTNWWDPEGEWNSDGKITIYNNFVDINNTGLVFTTDLFELYKGIPTGVSKPNSPTISGVTNPDYIQSPVRNLEICPIDYSNLCPDILYTKSGQSNQMFYELGYTGTTIENPGITSIRISMINLSTPSQPTVGTPQIYNYPYPGRYIFSGFTNTPTGNTFGIKVEHFSGDSIVRTCIKNTPF
jgi:hypothetical protein